MTASPSSTRVFILAGGMGTRSENPELPKILQEIAPGVTLLDNWISQLQNQGFRDICIIGGHGFDMVCDYLNKVKTRIKVSVVKDEILKGTLAALRVASLDGTGSALVVSGDTFSSLNYAHYLSTWIRSQTDVGVMVHRNDHPQDSDTLEISETEIIGFRKKGASFSPKVGSFAITGGFFAKLSVLRELRNLERPTDVIESLFTLSRTQISAIVVVGASMDTGTPARLMRAREAWDFQQRSRVPQAVFLDRDGTIFVDLPQGRKAVGKGEISPEDARAISAFNRVGTPVFIVTNQPAVAKGWITTTDVERVHSQILSELSKFGAWVDEFAACFHHPETGFEGEIGHLKGHCNCRKPRAGLAQKLIEKHGLQHHSLSVFGDSDADEGLAWKLGAYFTRVCYNTSNNLANAIGRIERCRQ